jgi:hypothetical protein
MRRFLHVLAICMICAGIVPCWQKSHAEGSPADHPWKIPEYRSKPQTPMDPVDVAARVDLGAATRWWEFVCAFSLTEKGTEKVVALYWSDSNQNGSGSFSYPNRFSLHAATRECQGKWVGQKIYSSTRCQFNRVLKREPSSITVELQPNFEVYIDPQQSAAEQEESLEIVGRANTPFAVRISMKDGKLAPINPR